jgi:hypothetical protein
LAQLEVVLARRQVGLVGREGVYGNRERGKKGLQRSKEERLNLACDVLSNLCYMITLIMQQYATICHAMP